MLKKFTPEMAKKYLAAGHFPEGSMAPKVRAAAPVCGKNKKARHNHINRFYRKGGFGKYRGTCFIL